jgi:hypothetical protein
MTCIGERLRFSYLEGRDLITWRTGEAKINSLGEKYDMYWGMPSILILGERQLINRRTGVAEINSQGEKYDMYWGTP